MHGLLTRGLPSRCGPSEFQITGNIRDIELWQDAHEIDVPVLLLDGRHDETTELYFTPWFTEIPKVKWAQLENTSHMGFSEERERYRQLPLLP
ncbi:hypothetical protein B0T26DRAFT_649402 [Lasiosphaeria miniovina]|uniref:Proline iminopeptidase n=1 Tax=Lasiosphaeria miniovina TaxID=1954250 RepID=A0AA40AB06_9PEZI|nr:uncharacterized protein B0T26DRAFT_649402 [Lasiosphaeria miniovina]KAK0712605.1 hypothetical protein B0T26DRAFT_649402 [Lasiosphaeria miniovina]